MDALSPVMGVEHLNVLETPIILSFLRQHWSNIDRYVLHWSFRGGTFIPNFSSQHVLAGALAQAGTDHG